mmetsp:Transcript_16920/g.30621  ORF Transcript_16920/g.30621 Transcript_16920/m.30621 type:complete len:211 (+) Transcript_16920:1202-1834(+)
MALVARHHSSLHRMTPAVLTACRLWMVRPDPRKMASLRFHPLSSLSLLRHSLCSAQCLDLVPSTFFLPPPPPPSPSTRSRSPSPPSRQPRPRPSPPLPTPTWHPAWRSPTRSSPSLSPPRLPSERLRRSEMRQRPRSSRGRWPIWRSVHLPRCVPEPPAGKICSSTNLTNIFVVCSFAVRRPTPRCELPRQQARRHSTQHRSILRRWEIR